MGLLTFRWCGRRCLSSLAFCVAALVLGAPGAGSSLQAQATAVRVSHDGSDLGTTVTPPTSGSAYGPPESVRRRDAELEAAVPPQYAPPSGMCRIWVQGVPPAQQPAPTQCAKAVRVRTPNSLVVFGHSRPTTPGTGAGMPQIIRTGGDHPVVGTEAGSSQIATDKSIVPGSSDAAGSGSNKGHPASARRVPSAHPNPPAPHVSVHVHH